MEYGVKSSRVVKSRRDGDLGPGEETTAGRLGCGFKGSGRRASQESRLKPLEVHVYYSGHWPGLEERVIIINTSTASARDVVVGGITTVLFLLKPLRRGAWVREQERGQAYKGTGALQRGSQRETGINEPTSPVPRPPPLFAAGGSSSITVISCCSWDVQMCYYRCNNT